MPYDLDDFTTSADRDYRHLPWLHGKGMLFAIYGSSSIHYADELEAKILELQHRIASLEGALEKIATFSLY